MFCLCSLVPLGRDGTCFLEFVCSRVQRSTFRVSRSDYWSNGVVEFDGMLSSFLFSLLLLPRDVAYPADMDTLSENDAADQIRIIKRRIRDENGRLSIQTGLDYSDLLEYPRGAVIIDPTVGSSYSATHDTWLENTYVKGNNALFIIGKHQDFPKKRSVLKFDFSGIPSGSQILDAKLRAYMYGAHKPSWSGESFLPRTIQAHAIFTSWDEATAKVNYPWHVNYGNFGPLDLQDEVDYFSAIDGSLYIGSAAAGFRIIHVKSLKGNSI